MDLLGYFGHSYPEDGSLEYTPKDIACYPEGMSRDMIRKFKFVNVDGGAYHDVTIMVMLIDYTTQA